MKMIDVAKRLVDLSEAYQSNLTGNAKSIKTELSMSNNACSVHFVVFGNHEVGQVSQVPFYDFQPEKKIERMLKAIETALGKEGGPSHLDFMNIN